MGWIDEAGKTLGFEVKNERRSRAHGKIVQIDSMWFKNQRLFTFLEAERRWEMNHIIGHLTCGVDYAVQEKTVPLARAMPTDLHQENREAGWITRVHNNQRSLLQQD